jgi:hypothetical protein
VLYATGSQINVAGLTLTAPGVCPFYLSFLVAPSVWWNYEIICFVQRSRWLKKKMWRRLHMIKYWCPLPFEKCYLMAFKGVGVLLRKLLMCSFLCVMEKRKLLGILLLSLFFSVNGISIFCWYFIETSELSHLLSFLQMNLFCATLQSKSAIYFKGLSGCSCPATKLF